MALDGTEIRIAQVNGAVYVAPVGTTAPTTATSALDPAFTHLGYVTEDGVTITPTVDLNPIMAWQSAAPVAYGLNEASFEFSFTLMQTNRDVTSQYFFGQSWVMGPSGLATLDIPSNPSIADLTVALVVEYEDSAGDHLRYYVERALCTERQEITLTRSDPVVYGLTYVGLDTNGTLGRILTDSTDIYSS